MKNSMLSCMEREYNIPIFLLVEKSNFLRMQETIKIVNEIFDALKICCEGTKKIPRIAIYSFSSLGSGRITNGMIHINDIFFDDVSIWSDVVDLSDVLDQFFKDADLLEKRKPPFDINFQTVPLFVLIAEGDKRYGGMDSLEQLEKKCVMFNEGCRLIYLKHQTDSNVLTKFTDKPIENLYNIKTKDEMIKKIVRFVKNIDFSLNDLHDRLSSFDPKTIAATLESWEENYE